jgi:hypothetical protein
MWSRKYVVPVRNFVLGETTTHAKNITHTQQTANGCLSNFEFSDFEVQRMSLCWKLSYSESCQLVLVPAILEEQVEVLAILNFLCFQKRATMDFDCPFVDFQIRSRVDFLEILHLC